MTPTSFIVTWADPTVGTTPFSKQVQYRVGGTTPWVDNPAGITTLTTQEVGNPATGGVALIPATLYQVRVHIWNSAGDNFSTFIEATTLNNAVSPNGTRVPQDASSILDANGHTWAIVNGQVSVDGGVDTGTGGVIELDYVNGAVWQENTALDWWYKILPTDTWLPIGGTKTPPSAAHVSPNGTRVPQDAAQISDANGHIWTINGGQVAVDGVVDTGTSGVIELDYVNGAVWQENASLDWWYKILPTDAWLPTNGTKTPPQAAGPPPPPPPGSPSPNGTRVPQDASLIRDANGHTWTIVGGQVAVDTFVDSITAGVIELAYVDGAVWQENSALDWWYKILPTDQWLPVGGTKTPPVVGGPPPPPPPPPGPPPPPPPPPSGTAPPMAAAVGFNTRTFGPNITIGSNWFYFDLYGGGTTYPGSVTQLANGAVRCNGNGPNGWNGHLASARYAANSKGWSGVSFGGGAYFEALLRWDNDYQQVGGWPAWWANEGSSEGYGTRTTGGQKDAIEMDFMEFWRNDNYGAAIWHWNAWGDTVDGVSYDTPGDHANPHLYGFLWVPSTPSAGGYARAYYDRQQIKQWTWPRYTGNDQNSNISVMDVTHQILLLGTSAANPMTVYSAEVWQANTNNNLT